MNTELCFGQRIDPENNLVECWFTHGALDWIKQQDWSDKIVWMFGAGLGDIWLAKRCKELHVVERDWSWINKCHEQKNINDVHNLTYHHRPCNDCCEMDGMYCDIPFKVDVIINDDAYRYEVVVKALTLKYPLVLITDNWQQSYVFMCPAAEELLKGYDNLIYEQADHLDNDGINKWKTAIHFIK
jgi:hypothetical protein